MTDSDVVGLRALAEKARAHTTGNRWLKDSGGVVLDPNQEGNSWDGTIVCEVPVTEDVERRWRIRDFIAAANPSVVLALLDEITTLRAERDDAVREMHSRELHHFEEEQRSAQLRAALADRDARIKAALEPHTEREWRPLDGTYLGGTVCNHCRRGWPCRIVRSLSGPAVPVPQDNPEANTCLDCGRSDGGCDRIADVRPKNGEKP